MNRSDLVRDAVLQLAGDGKKRQLGYSMGLLVGLRLGVTQPEAAVKVAKALDKSIGLSDEAIEAQLHMAAVLVLATEMQAAMEELPDGPMDAAAMAAVMEKLTDRIAEMGGNIEARVEKVGADEPVH